MGVPLLLSSEQSERKPPWALLETVAHFNNGAAHHPHLEALWRTRIVIGPIGVSVGLLEGVASIRESF